MYTEEEAKVNWCVKPTDERCCASACMAWRWDGEVIWSGMSKAWLAKDVPEDAETNAAKGYCGLAGKP